MSEWHCSWLLTYDRMGWEVEKRVEVGGHRYVLDAEKNGSVVEFVHSLSASYQNKHRELLYQFPDVRWLMDGDAFVSETCRPCNGRTAIGYRRFLKPTAYDWVTSMPAGVVAVHYEGELWRLWRDNVWYPADSDDYRKQLQNFDESMDFVRASTLNQQEA